MTIVVTGVAGFIGFHLARRLLARGESVVGVDVLNDYYDIALKEARLSELQRHSAFRFERSDIADAEAFSRLLADSGADRIVHLAAQAGVRESLRNPFAYERANIAGQLSVLEACRHAGHVKHLVYASSSSVYGERSADRAFHEDDVIGRPASLYAATKRSGELISETYSALYGLSQSCLRFFTVYGPLGRPDMAYFSFTRKILAGETIEVFGGGQMARDFTYIDDIVDGIVGVLDHPAAAGEHRLFNIGDSRPVGLMRMIEILEQAIGIPAKKKFLSMQPGDVSSTYASVTRLNALTGYAPKITLEEGLPRFVAWYREFYKD